MLKFIVKRISDAFGKRTTSLVDCIHLCYERPDFEALPYNAHDFFAYIYQRYIKDHEICSMKVSRIKKSHIQSFFEYMKAVNEKDRSPLFKAEVSVARFFLTIVLDTAEYAHLIMKNPCSYDDEDSYVVYLVSEGLIDPSGSSRVEGYYDEI